MSILFVAPGSGLRVRRGALHTPQQVAGSPTDFCQKSWIILGILIGILIGIYTNYVMEMSFWDILGYDILG